MEKITEQNNKPNYMVAYEKIHFRMGVWLKW
jgi:hypothetical protein